MKKAELVKTIKLLDRRCEFLHKERLRLIEDSVNLWKIPNWIKWLFGADFNSSK